MLKDEVLQYLRDNREKFARDYGVKRIGVFGSVLSGRDSEVHDIDVLVEMESPTFDQYMDLKFEIEGRFGKPVDLVLKKTVKELLRPIIERDTVYA